MSPLTVRRQAQECSTGVARSMLRAWSANGRHEACLRSRSPQGAGLLEPASADAKRFQLCSMRQPGELEQLLHGLRRRLLRRWLLQRQRVSLWGSLCCRGLLNEHVHEPWGCP